MKKQNLPKEKRQKIIKWTIGIAAIAVVVALLIWMMPWIISLKDEAGRKAFQDFIYSKGIWGVCILFAIQVLQVVIAIIPGEPIEVIAGLLYGTFWGYVICTLGMLVGTILIFYGVRWLGSSFINTLTDSKKFERFSFLHNEKKLETIVFLLFFIPGTPKDVLTYFMPLTRIRPISFFVIVTIARIPSIVSSTFAGESLGQGEWVQSIIIFLIIGAVGILGIWVNDRLMKKREQKKQESKTSEK